MKILPWEIIKVEFKKIGWLVLFMVAYIIHVNVIIFVYLGHLRGVDRLSLDFPEYSPAHELLTSVIFATLGGGFFAVLEVFFFSRKFKQLSYGTSLLLKSGIFILLTVLLTTCGSFFYNTITSQKPFYHPDVIREVKSYMTSIGVIYNMVIIMVPVIGMVFLAQINDKMGQGVLWQLLTGKYHRPKEQTRIFMFLDLKSSTTIAEKMGHSLFYDLLNDFFADITDPIIKNKGEIYQYIGDEVIISWTMPNGTTNANCVRCFFDVRQTIEENARNYEQKYGLVPEFKAGMHFGKVTTGEIGVIKREITHSGDVLNTTARIQSLCNSLNSTFIISQSLADALLLDSRYKLKDLGALELKGKVEKVELLAVSAA